MPSRFVIRSEENQQFARSELLTNIGFVKDKANKLSLDVKLHLYGLIIDAVQEYLEAEEDMNLQVQNGRPSDHVIEVAPATVEGVGR
jgi:hypothetical protein